MREELSTTAKENSPSPVRHLSDWVRKVWEIRIFRFLVIGVVNTLFSYLIYTVLVLLGLHYSLATLIATILGIIFNFFTTGRIVFKNQQNALLPRFVLVYGLTYGVHVLLLGLLIDRLGVNKLIAEAIVTLPIALLSYLLNSIITFKTIQLRTKP